MSTRLALACVVGYAADAPRHITDLVYATVDGKPLGLVVFVHGGAWKTGSKTQYPAFVLDHGFAVASLDFRSSNDASTMMPCPSSAMRRWRRP